MKNEILYQDNARKALENGISILAEAVAITMGPKGRNVVLAKKYNMPEIVNDGVTIAKEIFLEDSFENAGASLVKEAAAKTNENAGDGTTTATVLAYHILKEGLYYSLAGIDPLLLKAGMLKSVKFVSDQILEYARPVKNSLDIQQIATISANNDIAIGKIIAEAFSKAGREGIISLEEGKSINTELEITEGMQFNKGILSPYFMDNNNENVIKKENPYILLTDLTLTSVQKEIIPLLEKIVKLKKSLVIIARDIEQKALSTLIMNKIKGKVDVIAIKAPGFGNDVKDFLEDISILTKGQLIHQESDIKFNSLKHEVFGQARQIIITTDSTTIIANKENPHVEERCQFLRKQIEISDSIYEKEKLENRLTKLSGSVAVIKIGASTEVEMREKHLRFEDSINACKASIAEGIVPGGGITLAQISNKLNGWAKEFLKGEEQLGATIIAKALIAPFIQIVTNSGNNGTFILDKLQSKEYYIGYDAMRDEFVDLFDAGIIDPAKVTRCALQNAASVASMILTTECVIPQKITIN
uniref:chaperonin GroEL n=1 Tax=Rhodaphanes brevistipitata TaxID=446136 RepID=UPI001FCDFFD9|nr:chaperonin GroEL [Rhodaphanes brevistipitata]UNJ18382.1 chaperonin GroEL [Rhodaphanes brevistipitata]